KPELVCEHGLRVLRYHTPPLRIFDPRRTITHQKQTQRLLQTYVDAVDVAHGHSLLQYAGVLSQFGNQARMIYSVHSPARLEIMAQRRNRSRASSQRLLLTALVAHRIERHSLDRSDCITAYSQYTRSLLEQFHGLPVTHKVQVVTGWVDLATFYEPVRRHVVK